MGNKQSYDVRGQFEAHRAADEGARGSIKNTDSDLPIPVLMTGTLRHRNSEKPVDCQEEEEKKASPSRSRLPLERLEKEEQKEEEKENKMQEEVVVTIRSTEMEIAVAEESSDDEAAKIHDTPYSDMPTVLPEPRPVTYEHLHRVAPPATLPLDAHPPQTCY